MCLTAHWIDEKWNLKKKILNFCQISNHKGVTIGKLVYHCLQDWGIDRVFTITVDNASSNDGAIKFLKTLLKGPSSELDCKYLHLRCCAHIINLVVRDGLEEHITSVDKIRNAVRYLRSSPSRLTSFEESVEFEKIDCGRKPCLDVDTRWNSTFLMLETALKFPSAFDRLQVIDPNYRSYFCNEVEDDSDSTRSRKRKKSDRVLGAPEEDDWEYARSIMEYLRIFFSVTKKISGSKYVTANLFFGELVTMHATISQMCEHTDEKKRKMALSMKDKYYKYWDNLDNMNFLLHVPLVLDPRNKLYYLKYCLGLIYGEPEESKEDMFESDDDDLSKRGQVVRRVKSTLTKVYKHYKMKADKEKHQNTPVASSSTPTCGASRLKVDIESGFGKYMEKREGIKSTEVDIYLRDGTERRDEKFDVLGWWKQNSEKFPILSQVARHVLAMPVSTVASESAFSTGGRVIDKFRSSLTPKTAEALICTQDWLRSTPADVEDMQVNGQQLKDITDNLAKIELEEALTETGQNSVTVPEIALTACTTCLRGQLHTVLEDMDRYPNACLEELEAFMTLWDVKPRVEERSFEALSMDELITQLRQWVCHGKFIGGTIDRASNAQEEARQKRKEALEEVV
ncbi:zinc finger BED domain-containing protein RICESLEEPER 2-like protein [Tanacetum coccineum]|uniref:Zinc finger BED domain-containing protein RICESLEEPER 2-like protein n=1 Tax=Tanacetum coccineum TaxID=301880 RepID=A0ABQ5HGR5_9ASTR